MAKGAIITEKVFTSIMILHEANPELSNIQIGGVFKVDASTVGKMIRCGTWEKYEVFKKEKAEKSREREKKRKAEGQQEEPQIDGQIKMDLIKDQIEVELKPAEEKPEMSEQTKMMRFQAAQVDKICMKLDRLNDTMSMVLRAVRKE